MKTSAHSLKFTLIELLIVISVIAILTSLLLPALSQARKTSGKIVCVSNEKQIFLAYAQYTSDHNGWIPSWVTFKPAELNGNRAGWSYSLGCYLYPGRQLRNIRKAQIFVCPSDPSRRPGNSDSLNDRQSYVVVSEMFPFTLINDTYYPAMKDNAVAKPSETIILGEVFSQLLKLWQHTYSAKAASSFATSVYPATPPEIRATHSGNMQNFIHADGHVETCNIYIVKYQKKFTPK